MSNSSLVQYTRISPNKTPNRYMYGKTHSISKITIHHMAGIMSVEEFGNLVANPSRQMSANYAIGNDGRIGLFCEEKDRSWCSSSAANDLVSITIEVSNCATGGDWPIGTAAYNSLIKLCVDICKRNNIKKLEFTGDKNGSLTYHYMFASTACLPIDKTELLTPNGWKLLKDIKLGDIVATAHIDDLSIRFSAVENMVPVKTQDTYIKSDLEATSDHRVVYFDRNDKQYVGEFKDIYNKDNVYLPNAGYLDNPEGLSILTNTKIKSLAKSVAKGNKHLTWDLSNMSREQAITFLSAIGDTFVSGSKNDIDIIQAISALNGVGTLVDGNKVTFGHDRRPLGIINKVRKTRQKVSCVTVRSGFILIRQHGRTTIVGNCPGPWIKAHTTEICNAVNAQLNASSSSNASKPSSSTNNTTSSSNVKKGDLVTIASNATYYTGGNIPDWVKQDKWYVSEIKNDRAVLGLNQAKNRNIQSPVSTKFLSVVNTTSNTTTNTTTKTFKSYTMNVKATVVLFDNAAGHFKGLIGTAGTFTIVDEVRVDNVTYGKLKSGAGWIRVDNETFRKGDRVRVLVNYVYGTTKTFALYSPTYVILEVSGDRAVISADGKNVTTAIDTKNIIH